MAPKSVGPSSWENPICRSQQKPSSKTKDHSRPTLSRLYEGTGHSTATIFRN